jgi:hypothetical protein
MAKIKSDMSQAEIVDIPGVHLVFWQFPNSAALSSRGLGQVVLSHQTRVRIPVALPLLKQLLSPGFYSNFIACHILTVRQK